MLVLLAGPNGAGKTTFINNYLRERAAAFDFVNPDEVARSSKSVDCLRPVGTLASMRSGCHLAAEETVMTNEDRVLDFIRRHPGRDDDEISATLRILPRQQVNQICHRLVKRGVIRRSDGHQGKLVNTPR